MTDRPIIFSGPMAWALKNGLKTETRRLAGRAGPVIEPGDRLYVRESFRFEDFYDTMNPNAMTSLSLREVPIWYEADGKPGDLVSANKWKWGRLRPSIHMPRMASRITLEVTGVREEPLAAITEEAARAEGISGASKDGTTFKYGIPDADGYPGTDDHGWPWQDWQPTARHAFCRVWNLLHGGPPMAFLANPMVRVISFTVRHHNIDRAN